MRGYAGSLFRAAPSVVAAVLMMLAAVSPRPARGDAVVGTGTASSCTEAALNTALGCDPTGNCIGDGNAVSHDGAHGNRDGDTDRLGYARQHGDADGNAHGVTNGDSELYSGGNCDAIANACANTDAHRRAHFDADPSEVCQRKRLCDRAGSAHGRDCRCLVVVDRPAPLASAAAQSTGFGA